MSKMDSNDTVKFVWCFFLEVITIVTKLENVARYVKHLVIGCADPILRSSNSLLFKIEPFIKSL